ncbi:MAG: tetratricopeptide repeat protein [Thermoplasmatales archaeon]|jgi:hypothetical protein|nr:tetratricopeptide repeat protein [Thermoplasmatales archaeon]
MVTLSIGQRIIMHLNRFKMTDPSEIYNIPWDLTQDGIATSIRISRAHASIELKKLRESGNVEERQTHIKGGKVKRKSYLLTPAGMSESVRIRKYAEDNGIDVDALLDLKRQDANIILENLDATDSYALGTACAFRVPVPVSSLPRSVKLVIPADVSGLTVIDERLRDNMMRAADPAAKASWHSYAADYWMEDTEILGSDIERHHERLYHLVESGRTREACKLISANMYDLIATANDDLHDTLLRLDIVPAKFAVDVLSARVETDLISGDIDDAENTIEKMREYDSALAEIYGSDLMLAEGDAEGALNLLRGMEDSVSADLRIARILFDLGRFNESEKALENVRIPPGDISASIERFVLMAKLDVRNGNPQQAVVRMMKARATAPDKEKKKIDLMMKELGLN